MKNDRSLSRRIDEVADEFDAALLRGEKPDIETYLQTFPEADRTALLEELLRIEIEFRSEQGESVTAAEYESRFPQATQKIRDVFDSVPVNPVESSLATTMHADANQNTLPAHHNQPAADGINRIGDYEILEEIARGGMGVVYKARQIPLNRIVALKLIKSGELAGGEEVQRFRNEAEAAAQLDHPNIVPIYEVGEHDGRHFFSMGLVQGKGLDARLKEGPLPPREAAGLIQTIAEAVQFAHAKGIVHRDLKPANVLLDADGSPRITDFGLAKQILDDSGMTATGQVMGTPSYMPPEQAAGRTDAIGPLADVYSLGAMLYALLTGRPPFQAANIMQTLKQVCELEPVSPRQLNSEVDRDLETICLKCLEKEPAQRYGTADSLADDLGRYLEHKPILARPVSRWEHGWRWVKRNRSLSTMAAAAFGLLLTLAIGGPWMAYRQSELKQDAKDEALRADKKADELQLSLKREQAALAKQKELTADLSTSLDANEQTLERIIRLANNKQLLKEPRFKPVVKELMDEAIKHYRQFIDAHRDDQSPEIRIRFIGALQQIAFISAKKGSMQDAIKALREALAIQEDLLRDRTATPDERLVLATVHNDMGLYYQQAGQAEDALKAYRLSLAISEQLVDGRPGVASHQSQLARVLLNIGTLYRATGNNEESLKADHRSLAILSRLVQQFPNVERYRTESASVRTNIGILYSDTGRRRDALTAHQQALALWKKLANDNPAVTEYQTGLARCFSHIGILEKESGAFESALRKYQQAARILESLRREYPNVSEYPPFLANIYHNIGLLHESSGRSQKALECHRQALEIWEGLTKAEPTVLAWQSGLAGSLHAIGILHQSMGNADDALTVLHRSLAISETLSKPHPEVLTYQESLATVNNDIGAIFKDTKRHGQAVSSFRRALVIWEKLAQENPTVVGYQNSLAITYTNVASVLLSTGKPTDVLETLRKALRIWKRLVHKHPAVIKYRRNLSTACEKLGELFSATGKHQDALEAFQQTLAINTFLVERNPTSARDRNALADSHYRIGLCHTASGRPNDAIRAFEAAKVIRVKLVEENPGHVEFQHRLADDLNNVGVSYESIGRGDKARQFYQQALPIRQKLAKENPTNLDYAVGLGGTCCNLGNVTRSAGQFLQAVGWYNRAVAALSSTHAKNVQHSKAESFLRSAFLGRAQVMAELGRHEESAANWCEAGKLLSGRLQTYCFIQRALSLSRAGKHVVSARIGRELLQGRIRASDAYDISRLFSICSRAAGIGKSSNRRVVSKYQQKSIELLVRLSRFGYFQSSKNRLRLVQDPDLFPLHHLDTFRKFARMQNIVLPAWAVKPRSSQTMTSRRPVAAKEPKPTQPGNDD